MAVFPHLWSGTGNPCDWHNKTISDLAWRLNIVPFESDVGDFIPTGSKSERIGKIICEIIRIKMIYLQPKCQNKENK